MSTDPTPPALLDRVYAELQLDRGDLLHAAKTPAESDPASWRDHGEWLLLAGRLGAERVFFVGDDPVLVFSRLSSSADEAQILRLYRRAWSMARPRCLFVDTGSELRVYNLDSPPPPSANSASAIRPVDVIDRAAEVQSVLGRFHRDRFESGAAFEDAELSPSVGRADRRLLRDVRVATDALQTAGLGAAQAHALIERAILVRYLEDRGVLTDRYFDDIADQHPSPIRSVQEAPNLGIRSRFLDFLSDAGLTHALFRHLAQDFNGDLFVATDEEASMTTHRHLLLLRDLLSGVEAGIQEPLFLWAYDFSVVPTSLVSTMYELFYNEEIDAETSGTYYTPPELVEFVVADVLDQDLLERAPVVCDPACGSGIFLVEAYRRIVRFEAAKAKGPLSSAQLRTLMLERIAGCDIDEAAVRLAAFSLYIAFLNYQTPQDIQQAGPLPPLICRESRGSSRAAPLVVADAFSPLASAEEGLDVAEQPKTLPWPAQCFDVLLANPPWTEPKGGPRSSAESWARRRKLPIGDRSPSQLFLWRSLDLLAPSGVAAMLVSAKVLFNTRTTSQRFRERWLSQVDLEHVINFSEVRHDFFERAVAPFALLRFRHAGEAGDVGQRPLVYETARTVAAGRRGSAGLARLDRRLVDQRSLMAQDFLWKTYSAGDHRDHAFIARLGLETRLGDLRPKAPKAQYGYQRASPNDRNGHPTPAAWADLRGLRTFRSWGPIREEWLEPVEPYVKFDPSPALFLQRALIVRRGVSPGFGPHARLLDEPFAFRHHIYGIPLGHRAEWEAKVALGTVLSSLGRYWLFMVSGAWGTWKDEIRSEQLLDLPICLDERSSATQRIVEVVDQLGSVTGPEVLQLDIDSPSRSLEELLHELDEAVLDLFDLTAAERDLVNDFWDGRGQDASMEVVLRASHGRGRDVVDTYADVFRRVWRPLLEGTATLNAKFGQDRQSRVVAAVFETQAPTAAVTSEVLDDADWATVLDHYAVALDRRTASRLLSYGELRAVTDSAIVIVKRNERRLWSPTAARKDAEATAAQLFALRGQ